MVSNYNGAVQKEYFGQPYTTITLPKALKSSFIAVGAVQKVDFGQP
jgi:hypothetical protein